MRYKILVLSPYIILEIFKHNVSSVRIIKDTIPEDADFVRAFTNDPTGWGNIGLIIESDSFDDVKEGEQIPILDPQFEKVEG